MTSWRASSAWAPSGDFGPFPVDGVGDSRDLDLVTLYNSCLSWPWHTNKPVGNSTLRDLDVKMDKARIHLRTVAAVRSLEAAFEYYEQRMFHKTICVYYFDPNFA